MEWVETWAFFRSLEYIVQYGVFAIVVLVIVIFLGYAIICDMIAEDKRRKARKAKKQ